MYVIEPQVCDLGWPAPSLDALCSQLYVRYLFTARWTDLGHPELARALGQNSVLRVG